MDRHALKRGYMQIDTNRHELRRGLTRIETRIDRIGGWETNSCDTKASMTKHVTLAHKSRDHTVEGRALEVQRLS